MSWGMKSNFSEKVPVHTPTEVVGVGGCWSHQLFKRPTLSSVDFTLKILGSVGFMSVC